MKQLLAILIAGLFATAAFADASAPMMMDNQDKGVASSTTTTTTKHTTKKHHHVKHHKANKTATDASMAK